MKKLCILAGYYPINRGGAEYQAYLLAQSLKSEFDIFYISIGQHEENVYTEDGFRIYTKKTPYVFNRFPNLFLLKTKIYDILMKEAPDFIYQRMGNATTGIAAQYAKNSNCKVIWHIASKRDLEPSRISIKNLLTLKYIDKKYLEYGIRNVDYIVGQAKYQDRLLEKNYNRRCNVIVPNFHPLPVEPTSKHLPFKIVWISNIKKLKQPEIFLELTKYFKNRNDTKFILVGRPGGNEFDERLKKHLKSGKNLEYPGELKVNEVESLLSTAHILVNTSIYEGFSNTFIQAWMRKVPVVSLNVDPDNLLTEKGIGFLSGSIDQMARDIEKLIDNPDLLYKMGQKAQEYAFERHSLGNIQKIREIMLGRGNNFKVRL